MSGNSKYGQLFTEADMKTAVQLAVRGARRYEAWEWGAIVDDVLDQLAHSSDRPLAFPPDEPLFLLRGQDALALGAIGDYARRCRDGVEVGGPGFARRRPGLAHLEALNATWEAMERWQREHPERVQVPD